MRKASFIGATLLWAGLYSSAEAQLKVQAIAAGGQFNLALTSDGGVWQWEDRYSEVGVTHLPPARVQGLSGIIRISAGVKHALAMKSDGTIWQWGTTEPARLAGPTGVVSLAAGGEHSLALKDDGTVWAWGGNGWGQLGDGTLTSRSSPAQVPGLSSVTAIAAGQAHSLALKADGTVWAWGHNWYGQLGNGTIAPQTQAPSSPTQVTGLGGVVAIAAGYAHSLALRSDGTVWVWGTDGTSEPKPAPSQVSGIGDVTGIAAALYQSVALTSDGRVWEWGNCPLGGWCGPEMSGSVGPIPVKGLTDVATVALPSGGSHGLALKRDGTMWAWGGVLGNGDSVFRALPSQVHGLSGIAAVALGSDRLAVGKDGAVWAWGNDSVPAQVNGLGGIVAVAAGGDHNVALKDDGTVWQWRGQEAPFQLSGLTGVKAVAAGWTRSVALKNDGTVWKWTLDSAPEQVPNLTGVIAIAVAYEAFDWFSEDLLEARFLALRSDRTVWHWSEGPLADKYAPSAPAPVAGLTGIVAITGGGTSVAVSEDGSVWQWHEAAEAGVAPIKVEGLSGIVAVATGQEHRLALRSDGTVRAWGANSNGQLGDGTTMERAVPVQVAGLRDVSAIEASTFGSVAVERDGTVWTWGGVNAQSRVSSIPVQVVQPGSADLVITIRHDGDFRVGAQAVFTLTIANSGENASTGMVTVTDVLPLGLTSISATGDGWNCSAAEEVVTCLHEGQIEAGASRMIRLFVEVWPAAYPGVTNLATVSNQSDGNVSNNIAAEPTAVLSGPAN